MFVSFLCWSTFKFLINVTIAVFLLCLVTDLLIVKLCISSLQTSLLNKTKT